MKKFLLWFYLILKRNLKKLPLVLFLLLLPIGAFIFLTFPDSSAKKPQIGLFSEDADSLSSDTIQYLITSNPAFDFYEPASREALVEDIKTGKSECGYIFPANLTQKMDTKNYKGSITVIKDSGDFLSSITNEIVFSALFRFYGKNIAINYVNTSPFFSFESKKAEEITSNKYTEYVDGAATFHVDFDSISQTSGGDTEKSSMPFPVRGILSIIIYIAGLTGCVQWLQDRQKGIFNSMGTLSLWQSRIIYSAVPLILFSVSSLATLFVLKENHSIGSEAAGMLYYLLLNIVFCSLLMRVFHSAEKLVAMIPVLLIGSLLLCPIFIDLSPFVPIVGILNKLFLPYYYLTWFLT